MCVTDGHSNETLLTGIRSTYQAVSLIVANNYKLVKLVLLLCV